MDKHEQESGDVNSQKRRPSAPSWLGSSKFPKQGLAATKRDIFIILYTAARIGATRRNRVLVRTVWVFTYAYCIALQVVKRSRGEIRSRFRSWKRYSRFACDNLEFLNLAGRNPSGASAGTSLLTLRHDRHGLQMSL